MRVSKELLNVLKAYRNNEPIKIDFSGRCDLCGYLIDTVVYISNDRTQCPHCENEVYINREDDQDLGFS